MQIHHHSPEQRQSLLQLYKQICEELLSFRFSDPAHDEQSIRAHACLFGKKELLEQLIEDDYPDPAPKQDFNQNPDGQTIN